MISDVGFLRGKLTIVLGSSGSGKSSLLAAILKEMYQAAGARDYDSAETFAKVRMPMGQGGGCGTMTQQKPSPRLECPWEGAGGAGL
jgi:ABC-type cobalamin/Fe3+-siderophores transport system ATPase subunit